MNNVTADELVRVFDMQPHVEGGFFKESYYSSGNIKQECLPKEFEGSRCFSTAIYFLLPKGAKSSLHRLKSDEIWHFYLGGPMTLVHLFEDGKFEKVILGQDVKCGEKLQHVVPAGCWFGGYPNPGSEYSFVGCTVAPGFEFADFEMGNREKLIKQFPEAKDLINRLT